VPTSLVVTRFLQSPHQGQDQGHGMLGDGAFVDALGARQPDAPRGQEGAIELVDAGADRLDEPQPMGRFKQRATP